MCQSISCISKVLLRALSELIFHRSAQIVSLSFPQPMLIGVLEGHDVRRIVGDLEHLCARSFHALLVVQDAPFLKTLTCINERGLQWHQMPANS